MVDLSDIFDDDDEQVPGEEGFIEPPPVDGDIAQDLREDLLEWLVHGKTEPPRKPGLHCSSLWRTCARVPLLEKRYAEHIKVEGLTPGQTLTFDVGHALHHWVQNAWLGPLGRMWGNWKCLRCQEITHEGTMPKKCPKCDVVWRNEVDGIQNILYDEVFVEDKELDYCGHCDGIMISRAGKKFVFEFKTISPSQFKKLKQPKHAHVVQTHAYMNALRLKQAVVLYLDKGSQADWKKLSDGTWISPNPHIKSFTVKFDDELWATLVTRINEYHKAAKTAKALPTVEIEHINEYPRPCTHKGCDMAGDCGVRDMCFAI